GGAPRERIPARPGAATQLVAHGRDGGALRGGGPGGAGLPAPGVRAAGAVSRWPSVAEVSDRALALYALVRRASIEAVLEEDQDTRRLAQAERARVETERWLARESLEDALTQTERLLFDGASGSWPHEAI